MENGRIVLKKGKQKELVEFAKEKTMNWKTLSHQLGIGEWYLRCDIRNERRTLPQNVYKKLCQISRKNYDNHIIDVLDQNWGRKLGTNLSPRTKPKKVRFIQPSPELAEIIGIMLGDGNIYKKQYAVRVCGNLNEDRDYLLSYVKPLFKKVFDIELKEYYHVRMNELILYAYSKFIVSNLEKYGLRHGNKKANGSRIPQWVKKEKRFIIPCIRGLFDTDGSAFFVKGNVKIELYSAIKSLQKTVEDSMKGLGFKKSWTGKNKCAQTYGLYSKNDTKMFLNIIGFNNSKHQNKIRARMV